MNKTFYKILAFFFGALSISAFIELKSILNLSFDSNPNRSQLIIYAIIILFIFVALTSFFWRKGKEKKDFPEN